MCTIALLFAVLIGCAPKCFLKHIAKPAAGAITGKGSDGLHRLIGSGEQELRFFHALLLQEMIDGDAVYMLESIVKFIAVDAHFHGQLLIADLGGGILTKDGMRLGNAIEIVRLEGYTGIDFY